MDKKRKAPREGNKQKRELFLIEDVFHRAAGLHRNNMVQEAEELYRAILTVNHNHFGSLYNLGAIRAQQARFTEAVEFFRKATAQNPQNAEIYNNLGMLLAALGRH